MQHLHDDITTLRHFMRDLYREFPALRGELQMVALTPAGPVFVHPDKRAARAFTKASQKFFQAPRLQALWQRTLDDCEKFDTSMYSPFFDAFFVRLGPGATNGGFDLGTILRHELGHALDDVNFAEYQKRPQPFEMTADAFAVLHHLRDDPNNMEPIMWMAGLRQQHCGRRRHHSYNTLPAIDAAIAFARANDLSRLHITQLAAVARHISDTVCPKIVYERDARGRFLTNPFR